MRTASIVTLLSLAAMLATLPAWAADENPEPVALLAPGAKPLDPKADKVLVLPCDASGFSGTGVDGALCAQELRKALAAALGPSGFSLEPLRPALEAEKLGALAWRCAIGSWHTWEEHRSFDPGADPCRAGIAALPNEMALLAALAKGEPGCPPAPRFVLGLHVGCRGSGDKPDSLKLRILAFLWDLESEKVHSIVQSIEDARTGDVLPRMSRIPAEAIQLLRKAAPAKEAADPSKLLKKSWKLPVRVRKGARPIDLAKEKVFLLPCDTFGFGEVADEAAMAAALFVGTASAFGESGVPLTPLKPVLEAAGLRGLTYQVAYGAYHIVDFHDSFSFDDGCGKGIEMVPVALSKAIGLAVEKLGLEAPIPKYVFGLAVVSEGEAKPGVLEYRVIACLYDLDAKLLHSVAYPLRESKKDYLLIDMAGLPGQVFESLRKTAFK